MKFIQIGKSFAKKRGIAMVDNEDYERVSKFSWSMHCRGYAVSEIDGKLILMHRFVLNSLDGVHTDHIDGNKLNNRKNNLRLVSISQNNKNLRIRKDNISGYKGVSWDKERYKWFAKITSDKKQIYIGRYKSIKEAVRAYNKAAMKYHKKFAWLNPL